MRECTSCKTNIASLMYGINTRLAMNPGVSSDWVVVLPIEWARARVWVRVVGVVDRPGIISTSFITGTLEDFGIDE